MTGAMIKRIVLWTITVGVLVTGVVWCFERVPAGHTKVGTLFGEVQEKPLLPGLHFVNPLLSFTEYDTRNKTHYAEDVSMMTRDQLRTAIDASVQYHLIAAMTPHIKGETGTWEQVMAVHMVPALRSGLREQARSTETAEAFAENETQQRMQENVLATLQAYMEPRGVRVTGMLLRDVRLPEVINEAVEAKKERNQRAEREKAELQRFKTEQQKKVATAEAELRAAELRAEAIVALAAAEAERIKKVNEAVGESAAYPQILWMETLAAMAKDPAAKLYFMSEGGQEPLPMLHMGDVPGVGTLPPPIPEKTKSE